LSWNWRRLLWRQLSLGRRFDPQRKHFTVFPLKRTPWILNYHSPLWSFLGHRARKSPLAIRRFFGFARFFDHDTISWRLLLGFIALTTPFPDAINQPNRNHTL
jgi:hypothetical protein